MWESQCVAVQSVFCNVFPFHPFQRLRAATHYTVAGLCEQVAEDRGIQFSKQAIAAISEITFRQCGMAFSVHIYSGLSKQSAF